MAATTERAILAGGCFWGMQQLVRRLPGVVSTRVGYSGGDVKNATYRNHGTHAEAIEITFDPSQTSFRDLLEFLPTRVNPHPAEQWHRGLSEGDESLLHGRTSVVGVGGAFILTAVGCSGPAGGPLRVFSSSVYPGRLMTSMRCLANMRTRPTAPRSSALTR